MEVSAEIETPTVHVPCGKVDCDCDEQYELWKDTQWET